MIIALTIIITLLSVATIFSWYILFQVYKSNSQLLSFLDHLMQVLPAIGDTVNRAVDVMDRKEGRIGLDGRE